MTHFPPRNAEHSHQGSMRPCLFPDELQPHIRASYKKLALVVLESDLERINIDEETLIITCDWLMWHRLSAKKQHIIYYEFGILHQEVPENLKTDLQVNANRWVNDCVQDPTLFHHVSLGRMFGSEIYMAVMNFYRISMSIRGIVEKFLPEEIIFSDFRYDINHLNFDLRRQLVANIASDLGLIFTDLSQNETTMAPDSVSVYRLRPTSQIRERASKLYAATIDMLTRFRCIRSNGKQHALILVNTNIAEPLVNAFSEGNMTPVFLARTIPKRISVIMHCLRAGIRLVQSLQRDLSLEDSERLSKIEKNLHELCKSSDDPVKAFVFSYIQTNILNSRSLHQAASEVLSAEALINKFKPSRIVVDGVRGRRSIAYIELARAQRIKIDYIWHAPQTPQSILMGALGGDPAQPVFVDRCLSWGETNDLWFKRIHAHQPIVRVGSPLRNRYAQASKNHRLPRKEPADTNVLLLQYGFNVSDLSGLNANMYGTFVNCVRLLRENGYRNIKLKMHPGPGRWTKSQFEKIRNFFDLDCEILVHEPFEKCLAWADLVIGPSHTGAMFETLAANKPYHALLLPPHCTFDKSYFGNFPLIENLKDLPAALQRDNKTAERKVLDDLYSINDIPNPAQRFWQVMSGACPDNALNQN